METDIEEQTDAWEELFAFRRIPPEDLNPSYLRLMVNRKGDYAPTPNQIIEAYEEILFERAEAARMERLLNPPCSHCEAYQNSYTEKPCPDHPLPAVLRP